MYRVLIDRIPIHDPAVDDKKRLIHSGVVKQQANSAASFEFTIYPDNPGYSEISILASDVEVWADEELIFKGRPLKRVDGWSNEHKYICEGALAFFNDTIIRPYSYIGSVRGYLQKLITEHNDQVPAEKQFTLRNVTITDPNDTIVRSSEEYVVTMKEIQEKAVGLLGGYLRIEYADSRWYLDYLADGVHGSGQEITISKNLIDFEREQNAQIIVTRLIPLGAKDETTGARLTIESVNGGLDYLDDTEAIAKYGIIAATEIWDDVTVAANLKTKALARLSDLTAIIPSLSLTAVDLSLTDSNIEPIRLLDYVTVSDEAHDASGSYLVMSRTYNISNPASDTVTFGGDQPKVSGTISKVAAKADALPAVVLRTASEQARQLLENASFGAIQMIYDENGIWTEMRINNSKNPDTATAYWVYNANGWGYFDGETYTAAGTMNGTVYADLISAGIMRGVEVIADRGNIGGWNINEDSLSKTTEIDAHVFTVVDMARIQGVISGTLDEEHVLDMYPYYDIDGDGHITLFDNFLAVLMILGYIPNGTISSVSAQLNSSRPYGAITSLSGTGQGSIMGGFGVYGSALLGKMLYLSSQLKAGTNEAYVSLDTENGLQIANQGDAQSPTKTRLTHQLLSIDNHIWIGSPAYVSSGANASGCIALGNFVVTSTYQNCIIQIHIIGRATDITAYIQLNGGSAVTDATASVLAYGRANGSDTKVIITRSVGTDQVSFGIYLTVHSTYFNAGIDEVITADGYDDWAAQNIPNPSPSYLTFIPAEHSSSYVSGYPNDATASKGYYRLPYSSYQICWTKVEWTGAIDVAWGSSVYESSAVIALGTWAKPFVEVPVISHYAYSSGNLTAWVASGNIAPSTSSAGNIYLERGGTTGASQKWTILVMAIGKYQ